MPAAFDPATICNFSEPFNSKFTVRNNSGFPQSLCNQINCTEIVQPYGAAMVTVLRTPARPNLVLTSHVYTGVIL